MKTLSLLSTAVLGGCLAVATLSAGGCDRDGTSGRRGSYSAAGKEMLLPVAIAPASEGPISSYYRTTTTLEVEKDAIVVARVAGVIQSILVEEGQDVVTGARLLTIENDEFLHRLTQAEAQTRSLQANYARLKTMVDQDVASQQEFDDVRHALDVAKAAEDLARLTLSYTTVTAPFDGKITLRSVDVGEKVSPDTSLFTVADFQPLLARVYVPAKEFRKIQLEQIVGLTLDSDGGELEGRVMLISPIVDPNTGTIKVTIEVSEYPQGTRPGDFAEVRIVTEHRESSTLVAKDAVITDQGESVVFVATEKDLAERRIVQVGFSDESHVEITNNVVRPGDRIVIRGQRSLKDGAQVKVLDDPVPLRSAAPESVGS